MGEDSGRRSVSENETTTHTTTAAPDFTAIRNQMNDANPRGNKGKQVGGDRVNFWGYKNKWDEGNDGRAAFYEVAG